MYSIGDYLNEHDQRILVLGSGLISSVLVDVLVNKECVLADKLWVASKEVPGVEERCPDVLYHCAELTANNLDTILRSLVRPGDILLNLTVQVSSLDILYWCSHHNVLYLDTSNETWPQAQGGINPGTLGRRKTFSDLKRRLGNSVTAIVGHGANPGMVSHFAKIALLDLATKCNIVYEVENEREQSWWGHLSYQVGISAVHISERDTQSSDKPRLPFELVNTWSVDGFVEEAFEPTSFAWGSHETPPTFHNWHTDRDTSPSTITFRNRSSDLKLVSWLPSCSTFAGLSIPHPECFTIADWFSHQPNGQSSRHQPTVVFVYQPCDLALASLQDHLILSRTGRQPASKRILLMEITDGFDELGILLLRKGQSETYWYGSTLGIQEARSISRKANATAMQVVAGIIAGLDFLINNPMAGLLEPEEIDSERALKIAAPYLGKLHGHFNSDLSLVVHGAEQSPDWSFKGLCLTQDLSVPDA